MDIFDGGKPQKEFIKEDDGADEETARPIKWRDDWKAKPPVVELKSMAKPVTNVILTYTDTEPCKGEEACDAAVLGLQDHYQRAIGLPDLPYSFLISTDGLIYEARGWDFRPFVPKRAFPKMKGTRIVIAQIGKEFDSSLLPPADAATWDLIQHGIDHEMIHPKADKIRVTPWV